MKYRKSKAREIARKNKQRGQALKRELTEVQSRAKDLFLERAREMSSGPYSQAQLRMMAAKRKNKRGPYSRVSPAPPNDPAIINKQSGSIYRGWRVRFSGKGKLVFWNASKNYKWVLRGGTGKMRMMERPIKRALATYSVRMWRALMLKAKRRSLKR
jgi:hypothetical protein